MSDDANIDRVCKGHVNTMEADNSEPCAENRTEGNTKQKALFFLQVRVRLRTVTHDKVAVTRISS